MASLRLSLSAAAAAITGMISDASLRLTHGEAHCKPERHAPSGPDSDHDAATAASERHTGTPRRRHTGAAAHAGEHWRPRAAAAAAAAARDPA